MRACPTCGARTTSHKASCVLCGNKMITVPRLGGKAGFKAFRTPDGQRRWIAWAASAYRDREGEIFKTKALEEYIIEAYRRGDHGKLWFYHLPIAIGDSDFSALPGESRILVKMGTFSDDKKGRQAFDYFAREPEEWGVSVGYKYKQQDRRDLEYDWLWIFETSPVPIHAAAFPFSRFKAWRHENMELTRDQKAKLQEVFGSGWPELMGEVEEASKILEGMGFDYKAMDIAGMLQKALDRLEEVGDEAGYALVAKVAEALADKEGDEDEEYPKPTPTGAMGKKMAADHPLERLAAGTPLGPRRGQKVTGAKYRVNPQTGMADLVSVVTGDKAIGESQAHPLLQRMAAGTPLGVTRESWRHYEELGQKTTGGGSPLACRDTPLHLTIEEVQEARRRKEEELAQAQKAVEEARPRERYKFVTCPVCGYSHSIKGTMATTSTTCPQHGDIMQPTTSANNTAQARQAAPVQMKDGGGLSRSGGN